MSLTFKIYFLEFPWENVFGVITGNYRYLQLLENSKRTVVVLKISYSSIILTNIAQFDDDWLTTITVEVQFLYLA